MPYQEARPFGHWKAGLGSHYQEVDIIEPAKDTRIHITNNRSGAGISTSPTRRYHQS